MKDDSQAQSGIHEAFVNAEPVVNGDPAEGAEQAPPDETPPPEAYLDEKPEAAGAGFPLTDYGNGQRLVHYFGQDALWVPRLGWSRWDGKRWKSDEDEILVRRDAQQIAGKILGEMPFVALDDWQQDALDMWREVKREYLKISKVKKAERTDEDEARLEELEDIREEGVSAEKALTARKKSHRDHARTSGNTGKISNMLTEAQTLKAVTVDQLNSDPWCLCVENGVLRFETVEDELAASFGETAKMVPVVRLLPHDRDLRITKMARAEYDPKAKCTLWEKFLKRILPDPELRRFLQRWFGYSLTGDTSEHKLAFLYGHGRNGKSTAVDVIAKILDDYGTTIPIETLTGSEQRKGSDATPDLVRLPGARFVRSSEPEQGQKMKEALIKAMTGGEAMLIRRMMQEFVEIQPEFKLTLSGNYKPEVRGNDDGIWGRIMLVPFLEHIPAEERDRQLPQKLWAERNGILNWMVQGCLDWMANGLQPPAVITSATEEYRLESDPIRHFLETHCIITGKPDDTILARGLNDAFNAWELDRGHAAWTPRRLSNQILLRTGTVKGPNGETFSRVKSSNNTYRGIIITKEARELVDRWREKLGSA